MEGKTIQQIQTETAIKHGYKGFEDMLFSYRYHEAAIVRVWAIIDEAIEQYAHQQCELQKAQCADSLKLGNTLVKQINAVIETKNVCY